MDHVLFTSEFSLQHRAQSRCSVNVYWLELMGFMIKTERRSQGSELRLPELANVCQCCGHQKDILVSGRRCGWILWSSCAVLPSGSYWVYGKSNREFGDPLRHVRKEQHLSGDSGDEGSVKSSERGNYLPKVTQLEAQSEPKACDLITVTVITYWALTVATCSA